MIADYRTALQLIWISSALNLIVPGAEVRGMSIGVCLVLSGSVSALSLSLSLFVIHSQKYRPACAHTSKHIQSSRSLSQIKHKHIKSSSFSTTNTLYTNIQTRWMPTVRQQTEAHEKCMSLCVFHKKHSSGFHSHLGWNTTQEYQLRWQFGWQWRQGWRWTRIWDPQCHLNERVTVSSSYGASIACADYKTHIGLNVIEMLSSAAVESW